MAVHLLGFTLEWRPVSTWLTFADGDVIDYEGAAESAAGDSGLGFGDVATTRMTVKVLRSAIGSNPTARTPIRLTPTVDAVSVRRFVGVIVKTSGIDPVTLECEGILSDLSRRLKDEYSPLFELRPIATKTTASSIENPATGGYNAGIVNYALWQAGLRPYEQLASYPTVSEYYSCDQALFSPDYAWLAGDDGFDELLRCARASGAQLYQRDDGVVVYRQPFLLVSTPTYTFADTLAGATNALGVYDDISQEEPSVHAAGERLARDDPVVEEPGQVLARDAQHLGGLIRGEHLLGAEHGERCGVGR